MPSDREFHLPEFDESSIAAVHLLQGVVDHDEGRVWNLVLSHQTRLDGYFNRIGLRLVVEPDEGFAFLRQMEESELMPVRGYDQLPKLVRKKRLSFDATLACVLLRDRLRRFEEDEVDNARCVISTDELFEQWKPFFPATDDDVKLKKALLATLSTLEELKFIHEFTKEPQDWEIRRILKARMPVADLEKLRDDLKAESDARAERALAGADHE